MFFRFSVKVRENPPLVSIVIPCYNYGKFIEEAIESVLVSTYQNVEIIVVDDGPTDPFTINLLRNLQKPKTRVIFQKNQGLARARNKGIEVSKGEYILPLDADDKIDPTYIEKALYVLETYPKLGIVYGYAKIFGSQDFLWETGEYSIERLRHENIIPSCSVVRRSAWKKAGGYEPDRYQYDDWTFWIKLALIGYYGKRISEALFFHRKHSDMENMTDILQEKHKEYYDKIRRKFPRFFKRRARIFPKIYQKISYTIHRILPRRIMKILFTLKNLIVLEFVELSHNVYGNNKKRRALSNFNAVRIVSQKKKKIIIFLPWLSCGGVEKVTLNLIKELSDLEVFIITTQQYEYDYKIDLAFKAVTPFVYHLGEFLKKEQFSYFVSDLINCYDIRIALINHSSWAYKEMEQMKKDHPLIHFFDMLHNTVNEGYKAYSTKYTEDISKTIVISDEIKDCLVRQCHVKEEKVVRILNGIDLENKFNPNNKEGEDIHEEFNIPRGKFVVTSVGRLSGEKNPIKFLEIARELSQEKKFFFIMVGDGVLRKEVTEYIKKNFTRDNFLYVGNYPFPERILKYTSVLLNTSSIEGMPLTLIEALAMQVPVIAPRVGAIHEIVKNEENGLLLEKDPLVEEYVSGIRKMASGRDFYSRIKGNTRKSVEKKFSLQRMACEYRDVFGEFL